MGMFDEFHFVAKMSEKILCASGHPQTGALQTKDLQCEMVHYYVYENSVYEGSHELVTVFCEVSLMVRH